MYYIVYEWIEGYNDSEMSLIGVCSEEYYEKHKNDRSTHCYDGPYKLLSS